MIILTGSKGFIGQNFLKYLIEHSDEEIVTVDEHDCWDWIAYFKDWDKVSLILHQGAISATTETDIDKLHRTNVWFTIELFEKAIEHQIDVKFASSASVYGNTRKSLWATTPNKISPLNYYAITKLQIDYYIQDNLDKFSSIQSFRYFNVYGERQSLEGAYCLVMGIFAQQRLNGKPMTINGDGEQRRDFTHVVDICDALYKVGVGDEKHEDAWELGTGINYSVNEVYGMFKEKFGSDCMYIPDQKGNYRETLRENNDMVERLNWKPEDRLKEYIDSL